MYGKTVTGVIRSTFLVDAEGKVEEALYNVRATGHVAKLRQGPEGLIRPFGGRHSPRCRARVHSARDRRTCCSRCGGPHPVCTGG